MRIREYAELVSGSPILLGLCGTLLCPRGPKVPRQHTHAGRRAPNTKLEE